MTIQRSNPGDIELSVQVFRDGQKLETKQGEYEIREFVQQLDIFESVTSATIEMQMVINDSAGLIGAMTGSELFRVQIQGTVIDRTYSMRCYNIESRSRTNQDSDTYILNLCSDEFLKNEAVNIFGNTKVVFKDKTETSQIVKKILEDKKYMQTRKKVFAEETLNKHQFVIPNWRPFDTLYWMAERSVRKAQSGTIQNGFAFYENSIGYHFKSLDKMIEDINSMSEEQDTDFNTGKTKLYDYLQSPKGAESPESASTDQFKITTLTFPEEKNFLMGLRHGTWSGYSVGFDPANMSQSKWGASKDMQVDAYQYSMNELWDKMAHLKDSGNNNPIKNMDKGTQQLLEFPKRVRYAILPNQNFDPKYQSNPQKNYEQIVELQAYQWMRIESLKTIQVQVTVPGNLDLYVGSGVKITMASTRKQGQKPERDERYSGRYLIASLTQSIRGNSMTTEMLLMKDSTV